MFAFAFLCEARWQKGYGATGAHGKRKCESFLHAVLSDNSVCLSINSLPLLSITSVVKQAC